MTGTKFTFPSGDSLIIENVPGKALPVLSVQFDGENAAYVAAHFKNERTAQWFVEVLDEMLGAVHENKGNRKEAPNA